MRETVLQRKRRRVPRICLFADIKYPLREITIVFHGTLGQDADTDELIQTRQNPNDKSTHTALIDWSDYSQDLLQASFHGQRIGRDIVPNCLFGHDWSLVYYTKQFSPKGILTYEQQLPWGTIVQLE